MNDPFTVLNVLGDSAEQSYYMADPLNTGKPVYEHYKDSDLAIGVRINVFGREVVVTDLDPATRDYYRLYSYSLLYCFDNIQCVY